MKQQDANPSRNLHSLRWQIAAAFAASLSFFMTGAVRGYSSPSVPSMKRQQVHNINVDVISLITSLPATGSLVAALFSSPFLKYFGRRKTLILTSFPWTASFLMVAFSRDHTILLHIGRVLMGSMIGLAIPAAQIYIAECSLPRVRGAFSSLTALFLAVGVLLTYIIGAFVEWDTLAWILSIFPLLLMASMWMMPESPTWLLSNRREEEAKQALEKLRGSSSDDTEAEFVRIRTNVYASNSSEDDDTSLVTKIAAIFTTKWNPLVYKPLVLSIALMLFQQLSGVNVVIYNTVSIFEAAGAGLEPSLATIIVGSVQLGATFISVSLVDRAGRRALLLASGTAMAISMAGVGAHFYLMESAGDSGDLSGTSWLPLTSLGVFIFSYSIGYATVPYVVMGELFPVKYRNLFSSLATWANLSSLFFTLFTFQKMQTAMGQYSAFWFYGLCSSVGVVVVFFCLSETKGKSLEDIERIFAFPKSAEKRSQRSQYTPAAVQEEHL